MTREEADRLIDYRINRAIRCEEKRDASPFDSSEYWQHHEQAMRWHWRAEQLMPSSARTITRDCWEKESADDE